MKIKRVFLWILCAVMALTVIPAIAVTVGATAPVEGDWITYRFANEYPDEGDEADETVIYKPNAGYTYTEEGFSVIAPDFTDITPAVSFQSKEKVNLKNGVYLQFRIDEYSYGGTNDADHWIAPVITTEQKAAPGNVNYGGGWLTLIRGNGDGNFSSLVHMTDPTRKTFQHIGTRNGTVPMDDEGREIYTLSITWDTHWETYKIMLNGVEQPGAAQTTALLEKLSPSGEFYVGVNIHSGVQSGTAACTILKYGTSEATATTPVGNDRADPEKNQFVQAPIADPNTVPANTPAILWSPETYRLTNGNNINFTVQDDLTWKAVATDFAVYWEFAAKNDWSYDAGDFPVFGILLKSFRPNDGTCWYCAGEIMSPQNNCTKPFYSNAGQYLDEAGEYIFIPIDLRGVWHGRINLVRLAFDMYDPLSRTFGICFAGMFRSEAEAYSYAENYVSEHTINCEHKYEDRVVPPTCTKEGYTVHTCDLCGNRYTDSQISAMGHDEGTKATCTRNQVCLRCDEVLQPALGHNAGEAVSCTRDQECLRCGQVLQPAKGHSFSEQVTAPTCTEQGYTTKVCTSCGESEKVAFVPAKGHTPGEVVGCVTDQLCTVCGAVMQNAIGHNYIDKTVSPTCKEDGYTEHACTRCGDAYRDAAVKANGHTPGDWVVDAEPAVGVEGKRHKECTVCREEVDSEAIPALEEQTTVESEKTNQTQGCSVVLGWSGMVLVVILLAACLLVRKRSLGQGFASRLP